ncbi:phosphotransferase [Saccharothrix longispora]|uniref:Aminoglycoside phosphotransferase domain-containing protein n=1 Tax=Saccharothrix longispora TaxID=33920 RepID=A0ABU1PRM4_9PSEU|nr:phosphotransferase [Saccharothrix longispora]MDR6593246.1 hypothetical protein [Saccharothrix longispora]
MRVNLGGAPPGRHSASACDRAPDLAPAPLGADLGATPPRVRMSRVPGEPLRGEVTGDRLDALETALRTLWDVPADALPPRRFAVPEVWEVVGARFASAVRPPGLAGEAFDAARGLFAEPAPEAPSTGVGHGDPNLAIHLWDGARVRLVDFEDAGASDPAHELGTLVEHLSTRATDRAGFLARFDVDPGRLLARFDVDPGRLLALLRLRATG